MPESNDTTQEIWKPIPGELLGLYEASSLGRIRRAKPAPHTHVGLILKQRLSSQRKYLIVAVHADGRSFNRSAHRLVAMAFHGLPAHPSLLVNHKDLCKTNNRPENLEWVTAKENSKHAANLLRYSQGERHWKRKLMGSDVDRIRKLYATGLITLQELARAFGLNSKGTVWSLVNNLSWKSIPQNTPGLNPGS